MSCTQCVCVCVCVPDSFPYRPVLMNAWRPWICSSTTTLMRVWRNYGHGERSLIVFTPPVSVFLRAGEVFSKGVVSTKPMLQRFYFFLSDAPAKRVICCFKCLPR